MNNNYIPHLEQLEYLFKDVPDDLFEKGYTIIDQFISKESALFLEERITQQFENDRLKKAGIGTAHQHEIKDDVRGDYIRWIDNLNQPEELQEYGHNINELIHFMNKVCFAGVKDYEMHYTFYPEQTRYEKHIDQLKINGRRIWSFVLYLNSDWKPEDGGCLRIYTEDDQYKDFAPIAGRLALFRSDTIPHEVLTVNQSRVSITGWMLNQKKELTFI